ncbi:uncharacterized protein B0I36DRAFT_344052 [Microdochium trichocladiopsis]|uniref:Uncharacterized protein n=1 Tax=Microdochium trichocladiopsis TaxID=1682393 RepID=A0A9P8YHV0_9PEZI|nr:uncharacterized protein B0I36DRAFT_344052 [Microdochium trichocladiopsis]KAH7040283.1 hypothetical protein B0I36DRAFT_344052 [Microdochium trichocladiopsis]
MFPASRSKRREEGDRAYIKEPYLASDVVSIPVSCKQQASSLQILAIMSPSSTSLSNLLGLGYIAARGQSSVGGNLPLRARYSSATTTGGTTMHSQSAPRSAAAAANTIAQPGKWRRLVSTPKGRVYLGLGLVLLGVLDWEIYTWYRGTQGSGLIAKDM